MGYKSQFDGNAFHDTVFAQLTSPGVTASEGVTGLRNHTMAVTLALVDTDVDVQIEGSHNDTNFFVIPLDSEIPVVGLTVTLNVATITANGTFALIAKNTAIKFIRFNFVAENGGTAATLDAVYHGSN